MILRSRPSQELQKFEVPGYPGYPLIKLIVKDGDKKDIFEYEPQGWMTGVSTIASWVEKHMSTDHILNSFDEFAAFHFENNNFVIGLFDESKEHHNGEVFQEASRHFENVLFAESRNAELSQRIAEYLKHHHHLSCQVLSIGGSDDQVKKIEIPGAEGKEVRCHGPHNMQRPEWTDQFESSVEASKLVVRRTDKNAGWGQGLQFTCCDDSSGERETPGDTDALALKIPSITMFTPHDERIFVFPEDKAQHADVQEL